MKLSKEEIVEQFRNDLEKRISDENIIGYKFISNESFIGVQFLFKDSEDEIDLEVFMDFAIETIKFLKNQMKINKKQTEFNKCIEERIKNIELEIEEIKKRIEAIENTPTVKRELGL